MDGSPRVHGDAEMWFAHLVSLKLRSAHRTRSPDLEVARMMACGRTLRAVPRPAASPAMRARCRRSPMPVPELHTWWTCAQSTKWPSLLTWT